MNKIDKIAIKIAELDKKIEESKQIIPSFGWPSESTDNKESNAD